MKFGQINPFNSGDKQKLESNLPEQNWVRVVLIDDSLAIRSALRVLLNSFSSSGARIELFTSDNGVQGLGHVFITQPDLIIVDTTLPKYSGLEVLEYLASNKPLLESKAQFIVLHDGSSKKLGIELPDSFKLVRKRRYYGWRALREFIQKYLSTELNQPLIRQGLLAKIFLPLLDTVGVWANYSDLLAREFTHTKNPVYKLIVGLGWIFTQIITSLALFILKLTLSEAEDANIDQRNADFAEYRTRYYPVLFGSLAVIVLAILQAGLFVGTSFVAIEQTGNLREVAAANAWYDTNWSYRKLFTISETDIANNGDLTNFITLVNYTDSDLATHAQTDGDDIVFTSTDGSTKYDHELNSFNSGSGEISAWVEIPTVDDTADTSFYMYYGNGSASAQENVTGTWGDYDAVYHLEEDPSGGAGAILDSTSNNYDGTAGSSLGPGNLVSAQFGNGISFDGTANSSISMGDVLDIGTQDLTLQVWVNFDQNITGSKGALIQKGAWGNDGYGYRIGSSGSPYSIIQSGSFIGNSNGDVSNGAFDMLSVVFDRSANMTKFIDATKNNDVDISSFNGNNIQNGSNFYLGRTNGSSENIIATLDEVRVRFSTLPDNHIQTEYENYSDPANFFVIDSADQVGVCGNFALDAGEQCDDGNVDNNDACTNSCQNATCGDGFIQPSNSETCDDGNTNAGDGCSATCSIEAFNSINWDFRKAITVDHLEVSDLDTANLTDFPVYVDINSDADIDDEANNNGHDIVFVDSDGSTLLDYELVSYSESSGTASLEAWVKVPNLDYNDDTLFYLYYGNPDLTSQFYEDSAGVWSDYEGVWHFEEDPTGGTEAVLDSTGNNYHGTSEGSMTSGDLVNGQMGFALDFDGSNDAINFNSISSGDILDLGTNDFTLQAWIKTSNTGSTEAIISKGAFGQDGYRYEKESGGTTNRIRLDDSAGGTASPNPGGFSPALANGNWRPIAFVADRDIGGTFYYDGFADTTLVNITTAQGSLDNSEDFFIARNNGTTDNFTGEIDEVRVRLGQLSAGWIETEFNNQGDTTNFFSVGIEESLNNPCGNGVLEVNLSEQCDDGGNTAGDGCSATCTIEAFSAIDWSKNKTLTINATEVEGSSALIDFPVLVSFATEADLAADAQNDGFDIVFVDGDQSTVLDYEIVDFDGSTGELQAWVKIPSVSATSNTEFLLYYDRITTQTGDYYSDRAGVWSNYAAVFHADDDPSNGLFDAVGGTELAAVGSGATVASGDEVSGQIGNSVSLDQAQSDFFNLGDVLDIGTQDLTLQAWVNTTDSDNGAVIQKDGFGNSGYGMRVSGSGAVYAIIHNGSGFKAIANGNVNDGSWRAMAATFDRSGNLSVYEDGNFGDSSTISAYLSDDIQTGNPLQIGRTQGTSEFFDGDMDELRIRFGVLSSDWLATEYNNQSSPSSFITVSDGADLTGTFCGDGTVQTPNAAYQGERCDDGNNTNGDGCSATCNLENNSLTVADWDYYKSIAYDHDDVSGTNSLIDFPIWVELSDSDLASKALANGDDIVFTDTSDRILDYEIDYYSSGDLGAWVRIPSLSPINDTIIRMHYGNSSATNQEDPAGLWQAGYVAVYHLDSGSLDDRTVFNNDSNNTATGTVNSSGQFGNSFDYSSISTIPDSSSLDFKTNDFSVQSWINIASGETPTIEKAGATPDEFSILFGETSSSYILNISTAASASYNYTSITNTWTAHHATFDRDGSVVFYRNGASVGSTDISAQSTEDISQTGDELQISSYLTGEMDEIRISAEAKTGDWIATEYTNQDNPGATYVVGSEFSAIPEVSAVAINGGADISLTEATTTQVDVTATVTDANGSGDISTVTGKLYRSGIGGGSSCGVDDSNCYADSSCVLSACGATSCTATCSFDVEFFAEATDIGSPNASENWLGFVEATDVNSRVGSATSASGVEIETLIAFTTDPSISYGQLLAGQNTGATNQTTLLTNTGNSAIDHEITGDQFCTDYPTCSGDTIATTSQEYSLSPFTWGSGTDLTNSATTLATNLTRPTSSPSNSTTTIYWGIGVPVSTVPDSYSSGSTLTAVQQ